MGIDVVVSVVTVNNQISFLKSILWV